jgi:hypothetical protein
MARCVLKGARMRPRLSFPTVLGLVALFAVLLAPSVARAQSLMSIAWDGVNPIRKVALRGGAQAYWISYADCRADDTFAFNVNISGAGDIGTLQVWASITGADCSDANNRTTTATNPVPCYPVYYSAPQNVGSYSVSIRVQDIVDNERVSPEISIGHGTIANCDQPTTNGAAVGATLFFLLVQSGTGANNFTGAASKYTTKYDLGGPPPPSGVSAGVGEGQLFVHWTASGNADLVGYTIYCAQAVPAPDAGSAAAGAAGSSAVGGSTGTTGGDPGAGGGDTGGSADTGGASGAGGSGGQRVIDPNCYAPDLVPGQVPTGLNPCGTGNGSTQSEGTAKGLQNDQPYAVAVAGYDLVGNVGPLSTLACATPQLVDDFFDRYRAAGGQAGGGFCSIQRYASPWTVLILVGAWLGYALRRRRPER